MVSEGEGIEGSRASRRMVSRARLRFDDARSGALLPVGVFVVGLAVSSDEGLGSLAEIEFATLGLSRVLKVRLLAGLVALLVLVAFLAAFMVAFLGTFLGTFLGAFVTVLVALEALAVWAGLTSAFFPSSDRYR